jgi:Mn2+/Fe2+ NRAMP family transporter
MSFGGTNFGRRSDRGSAGARRPWRDRGGRLRPTTADADPDIRILGFHPFVASLAIACFGAALEVALQQAYLVAQSFGWTWGEDLRSRDDPGFSLVYTLTLILAAVPITLGLDPLRLTIFSMALTAASLPLTVVPLLFLLNDDRYVGEHRNGLVSNAAVIFVIALGFVLAVMTNPLQTFGGT